MGLRDDLLKAGRGYLKRLKNKKEQAPEPLSKRSPRKVKVERSRALQRDSCFRCMHYGRNQGHTHHLKTWCYLHKKYVDPTHLCILFDSKTE